MKKILVLFVTLISLCLCMSSCGTLAALIYLEVSEDTGDSDAPDNNVVLRTTTVSGEDPDANSPPSDDHKDDNSFDDDKYDDNDGGDDGSEDLDGDGIPDNIPGFDGGNNDHTPEFAYDVQLIEQGTTVWKYRVAQVVWASQSYCDRLVDEFSEFINENPDWTAPYYDDGDWAEHTAPFGDRIHWENSSMTKWEGDNHGIFLRTEFEISGEDIERIASENADLVAYMWYDNSCHVYINGTEVFVHDDSPSFIEGIPAEEFGPHDWNDAYDTFYLSSVNDYYIYEGNVAELLTEGTNTVAVSLCDCWGGREFDLGLYVVYN